MKRFERKRRRRGLGGRPPPVAEKGSPTRRSGRNAASGRASEAFRVPQAGLRNVMGEVGARPLAVREEGSPTRRSGRNAASGRASEAFRVPQAGKKNLAKCIAFFGKL